MTGDPESIADRIARLARDCPDHPWPLPKPSCPECARNAGVAAAARLARDASQAGEPDPFAPGTRVEVHEIDGGFLVFPAAEPDA